MLECEATQLVPDDDEAAEEEEEDFGWRPSKGACQLEDQAAPYSSAPLRFVQSETCPELEDSARYDDDGRTSWGSAQQRDEEADRPAETIVLGAALARKEQPPECEPLAEKSLEAPAKPAKPAKYGRATTPSKAPAGATPLKSPAAALPSKAPAQGASPAKAATQGASPKAVDAAQRSPGSAPDDDEFDFDAAANFDADEFEGAPASPAPDGGAAAAVEEELLFSQEDGDNDVIEEGSDRAAAVAVWVTAMVRASLAAGDALTLRVVKERLAAHFGARAEKAWLKELVGAAVAGFTAESSPDGDGDADGDADDGDADGDADDGDADSDASSGGEFQAHVKAFENKRGRSRRGSAAKAKQSGKEEKKAKARAAMAKRKSETTRAKKAKKAKVASDEEAQGASSDDDADAGLGGVLEDEDVDVGGLYDAAQPAESAELAEERDAVRAARDAKQERLMLLLEADAQKAEADAALRRSALDAAMLLKQERDDNESERLARKRLNALKALEADSDDSDVELEIEGAPPPAAKPPAAAQPAAAKPAVKKPALKPAVKKSSRAELLSTMRQRAARMGMEKFTQQASEVVVDPEDYIRHLEALQARKLLEAREARRRTAEDRAAETHAAALRRTRDDAAEAEASFAAEGDDEEFLLEPSVTETRLAPAQAAPAQAATAEDAPEDATPDDATPDAAMRNDAAPDAGAAAATQDDSAVGDAPEDAASPAAEAGRSSSEMAGDAPEVSAPVVPVVVAAAVRAALPDSETDEDEPGETQPVEEDDEPVDDDDAEDDERAAERAATYDADDESKDSDAEDEAEDDPEVDDAADSADADAADGAGEAGDAATGAGESAASARAAVDRAAGYRAMLERDAAAAKAQKRNLAVEDEAEESEDEDGAQQGLGDFGFGVPFAKKAKVGKEEEENLVVEEDDLEAIVDDVSDGEGDELAGDAYRAQLARKQEKDEMATMLQRVRDGFDKRGGEATTARGNLRLNQLVGMDASAKAEAKRLGLGVSDDDNSDVEDEGEASDDDENGLAAMISREITERHLGKARRKDQVEISDSEDEAEVVLTKKRCHDSDSDDDEARSALKAKEWARRAKMRRVLTEVAHRDAQLGEDDPADHRAFLDDEDSQQILGMLARSESLVRSDSVRSDSRPGVPAMQRQESAGPAGAAPRSRSLAPPRPFSRQYSAPAASALSTAGVSSDARKTLLARCGSFFATLARPGVGGGAGGKARRVASASAAPFFDTNSNSGFNGNSRSGLDSNGPKFAAPLAHASTMPRAKSSARTTATIWKGIAKNRFGETPR